MNNFLSIWMVIACGLMLNTGMPARASTYHSFLRINKVYVLYTDPIVPHADRRGNFWIGLQPFALLIGAQFVEASNGSATVILRGHHLTLTPGSMKSTLDGRSIRLATPAKRIGTAHHMVVPLGPLLAAFGLHSQSDKRFHVVTLTNPDLISKGVAGDFAQGVAEFEGPPSGFVAQARAFAGPPYFILPVVPAAVTQKGQILIWHLRNISTKNFPRMDVNILVSGRHGEEYIKQGIPFPSSFSNRPLPDPIKAKGKLDIGSSTADFNSPVPHRSLSNPGFATITIEKRPIASIVAWIVL